MPLSPDTGLPTDGECGAPPTAVLAPEGQEACRGKECPLWRLREGGGQEHWACISQLLSCLLCASGNGPGSYGLYKGDPPMRLKRQADGRRVCVCVCYAARDARPPRTCSRAPGCPSRRSPAPGPPASPSSVTSGSRGSCRSASAGQTQGPWVSVETGQPCMRPPGRAGHQVSSGPGLGAPRDALIPSPPQPQFAAGSLSGAARSLATSQSSQAAARQPSAGPGSRTTKGGSPHHRVSGGDAERAPGRARWSCGDPVGTARGGQQVREKPARGGHSREGCV